MHSADNRDDVTVETAMEEAQFPVDNGEALFPSVEEVRASNAGMSPGGSRRNIWRGSSSSPTRGTTQTKKKNPWLLTLLIALPLIVLLIIVPAVVVSQNNKEEEQAAAIPPPTYEELVNFLVVNQISLNSTFAYSDSPQSKAARWLAEEDGARLSLPEPNFRIYDSYMYMFRYVMAVNYYALNGPEWTKQLNFLSDADVCEWNDVAVVGDVVTRLGVLCQWVSTDDGDRLYVPFLLYLRKLVVAWMCLVFVICKAHRRSLLFHDSYFLCSHSAGGRNSSGKRKTAYIIELPYAIERRSYWNYSQ